MSDIFISYAREDRPRARFIAEALQTRGWSVFWDRNIPVGATWDEVIERELAAARAVIVLWSKDGVASAWVRAEAGDAAAKGKLIPALLENVSVPLRFRTLQAADLIDWESNRRGHMGWKNLTCALMRVGKFESTHPSQAEHTDHESNRPHAKKIRNSLAILLGAIALAAFVLIVVYRS